MNGSTQTRRTISAFRRRGRSTQRGSLIVIAVVALVVTMMIAIALMDNANATFLQGWRQPRLLALQSMADGGAQYAYWEVVKQNMSYAQATKSGVTMGNGSFDVAVSDNSASIPGTFKVVSTSHIKIDSYTITRIYSSGSVPLAPTQLVATASNGSITLTWAASTGATSYNIYRGTASGGESSTPIATGVTGTTYTDSSVTSGTTYYYYVTAIGTGGESVGSGEASATATAAGYVTITPSVPSLSNWYGQEQLSIVNTQPMTSLTIDITVQKTTGLTYNSAWNNFWGGYINQTYTDNGSTITYTYKLNTGDTQTSGSYYVADSFNLSGTAHSTTGDTYTVSVTAGGVTQNLSGHF